ncbi:MAG TPA: HlyD family efflux transporter periplasmic adaptor subunit [Chitinophagaceae bacterium]|nr:HlyD family efflux transporter periplasmic adaptor subunit [Chitinophagaceae bacterium]
MRKNNLHIFFLLAGILVMACHNKASDKEDEDVSPEQVQTPVTTTTVSNELLVEYSELNATSSFMQDNILKSNINGYIKSVNTKIGQHVSKGQVLFVLKTKEAESLGNTINTLDSSFHFSGVNSIAAAQAGYITSLDHQVGDYVQDGEQLAVISNTESFGFILNLPYELRKYVSINKKVEVILPDSTKLEGVIASFMPSIDSASQTQQVLIRVNSTGTIPENLIAKVRILKMQKTGAVSLPKQAVLSDEAQRSFWVMKMIDSVTAVKVPVVKGIETATRVEIIQPQFSGNDKILLSGNYGLPDTAKVKVVKVE